MSTQVLYRFRCTSCVYKRDFSSQGSLPVECPMCGAPARKAEHKQTPKAPHSEERRH